MRAFTVGRLFAFDVPLAGVEVLKWVGLVCMLQEHIMRMVLDVYPLWSYALGRLAFPLFAIAICRSVDCRSEVTVIKRLLLWAFISQAFRVGFDFEPVPFNVLFTFALGFAASAFWWRGRAWCFFSAACLALGSLVEFGMAGVLFVFALRVFFVQSNAYFLLLAMFALGLSQQAAMPFVAFLIASPVAVVGSGVSRVRGVFYWAYALQWPLFAGLRHVL